MSVSCSRDNLMLSVPTTFKTCHVFFIRNVEICVTKISNNMHRTAVQKLIMELGLYIIILYIICASLYAGILFGSSIVIVILRCIHFRLKCLTEICATFIVWSNVSHEKCYIDSMCYYYCCWWYLCCWCCDCLFSGHDTTFFAVCPLTTSRRIAARKFQQLLGLMLLYFIIYLAIIMYY